MMSHFANTRLDSNRRDEASWSLINRHGLSPRTLAAARDDVPAEMSAADAPAKRADGPVDRPGVPRSALEERRSRSETRVLHSAPFSLRHRASP